MPPPADEAVHEGTSLLPSQIARQPANPSNSGGGAPAPRSGDVLLWCCRILNLVTAICALLCAIALGIALVLQHNESPTKGLYEFTGQALRVFGIGIALGIMLVETEWHFFLSFVPLLDSWLGRGVLQAFEATLVYREATSVGGSDLHKSLQLYRTAACGSLLCCAGVYCLGGMLCIGAIRKARYRREEALSKAQSDLEALERRRADLQRILGRATQD